MSPDGLHLQSWFYTVGREDLLPTGVRTGIDLGSSLALKSVSRCGPSSAKEKQSPYSLGWLLLLQMMLLRTREVKCPTQHHRDFAIQASVFVCPLLHSYSSPIRPTLLIWKCFYEFEIFGFRANGLVWKNYWLNIKVFSHYTGNFSLMGYFKIFKFNFKALKNFLVIYL